MANAVQVSSVKATAGNAVLVSSISATATPPTPVVGNAVMVSRAKADAAPLPAANAGPDLGPVSSLATVQLSSAASTLSPTAFLWSIVSGGGELSSITAANPTLKVPATVAGTAVVLQLKVGTTAADSAPATVRVIVKAHQLWGRGPGGLAPSTLNARA